MYRCIVYVLLATIVSTSISISAFVVQSPPTLTLRSILTTKFTVRPLLLFWFGNKDNGDIQKNMSSERKKSDPKKGEGLSGVMDSMEAFQKAQQVGTLTERLVQELSAIIVEGTAADNKIRVFFNGKQQPQRVQIEESYLRNANVDDFNAALAMAMQDAHEKSREKMQEKLKELYGELGLPPATSSRD